MTLSTETIRQMFNRWRVKPRTTPTRPPSDVPAGHVAICVGSSHRRYVVRATYLNHPIFKWLLTEAEEEFGFSNQGPLAIPCDESLFEEILRVVSEHPSGRLVGFGCPQRCSHPGLRSSVKLVGEFSSGRCSMESPIESVRGWP